MSLREFCKENTKLALEIFVYSMLATLLAYLIPNKALSIGVAYALGCFIASRSIYKFIRDNLEDIFDEL